MNKLERAAKKYREQIEAKEAMAREKAEAKSLAEFMRAGLRDRMFHYSVSAPESSFWTEFYNLQVREYAREFGPKWTPETTQETDRMQVVLDDWDALVNAVRHIQGYVGYLSDYIADNGVVVYRH